ncbi:restriction endonuclease subunit S [Anaerotruncus rubiinfantis]|uniref:restriction endonuclease subunit S n=1 Tax=Anaerotruncus rubiinfantis TaxID=1720200 RepID=UPI0034A388B7
MNRGFQEAQAFDYASSGESYANLYRVWKTKAALKGREADPDTIYETMQSVTADLDRRFPGDAALFYRLYQALRDIRAEEIPAYLKNISNGKELYVPKVLSAEFQKHLDRHMVRRVLIAECEKYGDAIFDMIRKHSDIHFTLSCQDEQISRVLRCAYEAFFNVSFLTADIYSDGFTDQKFDLIFAVPAFGVRDLADGQDFICRELDLAATQNLLYHLNFEGELVISLPARITFAGGNTEILRTYIENNYRIKEIAELPSGLFFPYTTMNAFLFTFSTGVTDDVVLKRYISDKPVRKGSSCGELILDKEVLLFRDEFDELNGWNLDMAFSEDDDDLRLFRASPVRKASLRDVAAVFRGKAVKGKSETGKIGVINISNITDTGIDYAALDFIDEEERKVARYILEDGDVLVTSRGTTIKAAVFERQPFICIPSANLNVIRPHKGLRGEYLKLFLDTPAGEKMLRGLQRGSGIMNINFNDLYGLTVPVPPLETQDGIIREYNAGLSLYQKTVAAAEEAWQNAQSGLRAKIY